MFDLDSDFSHFKSYSPKTTGGVVPLKDDIKSKLNKEQVEVIEKIKAFLKSKDKYFSLVGKGGTGKTTIIAEALKGKTGIIGMAISHKASEKLSESIEKCYTVAKALGMKMQYNADGEVKFVPDDRARTIPIMKARIVVCDECSMITDKNMVDINNMTDDDVKIIYMGDFRQLPPIEEGRKPDADSKSFNFREARIRGSLTERVRQGIGNPIIELSDVIASQIESKKNNPYLILDHLQDNINKDGKGYGYVGDDYISDFVYDFQKDNTTRFIAFRNNTIRNQNKKIRNVIYNNPGKEYIKGELLIAKDSLFMDDQLIMKNSQEFFIDEVTKASYQGIDCWCITSEQLTGTIYVVSKEGRKLFKSKCEELVHEAKKDRSRWRFYYAFKNSFANVDYGYAINTHRSQGSTYKKVYLDFNDILNVSKTSDKEKCQSLYVGITRASDNLYLVDL